LIALLYIFAVVLVLVLFVMGSVKHTFRHGMFEKNWVHWFQRGCEKVRKKYKGKLGQLANPELCGK